MSFKSSISLLNRPLSLRVIRVSINNLNTYIIIKLLEGTFKFSLIITKSIVN